LCTKIKPDTRCPRKWVPSA